MKVSTVLVFLTVVAIGAGDFKLGPIDIEIPDDDDFRYQLRSASRDIKGAVDSAADFADNVASGQFAKDLVNPPSEDELRLRQLKKDLQKTMDNAGYAVDDFFRGAGNTLQKFRDDIAAAAGSASSRWTGYSGIVALIGTWVAILVVM